MVTVKVYGQPAPQGSKRFLGVRGGKGVMVESSKAVKPWREAVKWAAIATACDRALLHGPLVVSMVFSFARPKSHYRTGRNSHLLRDDAPLRPAGKPDLSKLLRSTEDALTDAGLWSDDAQVVECERAAKVYVDGDIDALDVPGALIRVRRYVRPTP